MFSNVQLADLIVPELFNPYVFNSILQYSPLVSTGIITNSPEFDMLASQPAKIVNLPFFQELTGLSEQIIENTSLTPSNISPGIDQAPIIRRARMWASTDLSTAMSGADPMAAIGTLVARFWIRDMQKELINILSGAFSASSMSSNILDITDVDEGDEDATTCWTASAFIDAQQLLGDASETLSAVLMHSDTKAFLKKSNLLDQIRPSDNPGFDSYQGVRVIVDDSCPVENGVYTTYLFGEGAIAFGNGSPLGFVPVEVDRDRKKGSGVDYLISRKNFILHPRGIKFLNASVANSEGPSRVELANNANWQRVYEPKQIRIVQFLHTL